MPVAESASTRMSWGSATCVPPDSPFKESIWRRLRTPFVAMANPQTEIKRVDLYGPEVRVLNSWGGSEAPGAAMSQLKRLAETRLDPTTAEGRRAEQASLESGILQPFVDDVLHFAHHELGLTSTSLRDVRFHYNGHMTAPMVGLFQLLRAFGLSAGSATRSNHSGTYPATAVIAGALSVDTGRDSVVNPGEARTEIIAEARRVASTGQILVVDKGSNLVSGAPLPDDIRQMIRTGGIRFLVHNSTDLAAMSELLPEAYMIDVAGSRLKALEARIIGEQYALLGAREARRLWKTRIGDEHVVVKGFGLLGRSIVEALLRLDMPRDRITVIDTDLVKRNEAKLLVDNVISEECTGELERAVVFVATPTVGADGSNVAKMAKSSLYLSLTSAGKGIDVESIKVAGPPSKVLNTREGSPGTYGTGAEVFFDVSYEIPVEGEQARSVTLINVGKLGAADAAHRAYALNLTESHWDDRMAVTPVTVALGTMAALCLDEPGLHGIRAEWEDAALSLFARRGLHEIRRLDEVGEESTQRLWEDLQAFSKR